MKRKINMKLTICVLIISMVMIPIALLAADKINLNTATQEELMTLERVGPKYAQRIIEYREAHGPFENIEDITKVKGIGPKTFDANKSIMTVETAE